METLDLVLIGIIVAWGLLGLLVGFAAQLSGILSYLFAAIIAIITLPLSTYQMKAYIDNFILATLAALALVFVLSALGLKLILALSVCLLEKYEKKKLDRFMGMLFGIFKGFILSSIIVFVLIYAGNEDVVKKSTAAPIIHNTAYAALESIYDSGMIEDTYNWIKKYQKKFTPTGEPPITEKMKDAMSEAVDNATSEFINQKINPSDAPEEEKKGWLEGLFSSDEVSTLENNSNKKD